MAGSWRPQLGDMPVEDSLNNQKTLETKPVEEEPAATIPAIISLKQDKFNWADEISDEDPVVVKEQIVAGGEKAVSDEMKNVQSDLGQFADGVAANSKDTPENIEEPEHAEVPVIQGDLRPYKTEMDVRKEDTKEEAEKAECSNVQDNFGTFEIEIDIPGKDTTGDSEQTRGTVVQTDLETSGLEVATQEDLMEGVDDKLGTPETQSAVAVDIAEVLNIIENIKDDHEHPEPTLELTKEDEDIPAEKATLSPASDLIFHEKSDTLEPTLNVNPSSDDKMDDKMNDRETAKLSPPQEPPVDTEDWWDFKGQILTAKSSPDEPRVRSPPSPKQSTKEHVDNVPVSYAKIAAAAVATSSRYVISMSPEVKTGIEKTRSKTPVKARVTPTRNTQSSTHVVPVIPRSFEKQACERVSSAIAASARSASPTDLEWEPVPTEASEGPKEWILQTPKKARRTTLTTPLQSAQKGSDIGNEDVADDEEENTNTPSTPSTSSTPYTPTKSKPKRRRPLSKTAKATKTAQAQALAASLAPVIETEAKAGETEAEINVKGENEVKVEAAKTAEAENDEVPAVETAIPEINAVVKTEDLEVIEETEVPVAETMMADGPVHIEVKEEVKVIELAGDEVDQPGCRRSSIMFLVGTLLVAWVLYSFIYYMPDILEYLKESFRSDVPDL